MEQAFQIIGADGAKAAMPAIAPPCASERGTFVVAPYRLRAMITVNFAEPVSAKHAADGSAGQETIAAVIRGRAPT
jgi:hypothetical protein